MEEALQEEQTPPPLPKLSRPAPVIKIDEGLVACPACGVTKFPSMELNLQGNVTPHCPECGREHYVAPPPPPANVQDINGVRPDNRNERAPEAWSDPVEMIRARLAFLDAEIEKLAAFRSERTRLRRMLKAGVRPDNRNKAAR